MQALESTYHIEGYFGAEDYPSAFHSSLTPGSLDAAARRAGLHRSATRRPFRMLDIGCGDGYGLALMAAAHPEGEFVGIDALESHVARGHDFAEHLGLQNLQLRCQTFEQALQCDDGLFDYIVCHGVISWVNADNRARAIRLGASRLAPNGIFYLGYNAMPGMQSMLTFQKLVHRLADRQSGSAIDRFRTAASMIEHWRELPIDSVSESFMHFLRDKLDHAPENYLTHEYLQDCWQPQWAEDVHGTAAQHGLKFLSSSRVLHHRPDLRLRKTQRAALEDIDDPLLRETLTDSFVDETFRQDLFVRDDTVLIAPADAVLDTWLGALCTTDDLDLQCRTPAGVIRFDNPATRAVIDALQHGPAQIADLAERLPFNRADVLNAIDCLLVKPDLVTLATKMNDESFGRVNQNLLALAAKGDVINGLIGRSGPVSRTLVDILLLSSDAQSLVDRASGDDKLCKTLFTDPKDVHDSRVVEVVDRKREIVNTQCQRLGVQV